MCAPKFSLPFAFSIGLVDDDGGGVDDSHGFDGGWVAHTNARKAKVN